VRGQDSPAKLGSSEVAPRLASPTMMVGQYLEHCEGGPGGGGGGVQKIASFWQGSSIICEEHRVHGLGSRFVRLVL